MNEVYILISIIFVSWVIYHLLQKYYRNKTKKLLVNFDNYLDNYKLQLLQDFEIYKKSFLVTIYENNNAKVIKTNKFINSDVKGAFEELQTQYYTTIKNKLLIGKSSFFNFKHFNFILKQTVNQELYKYLLEVFNSDNQLDKLKVTNKEIEILAIELAIKDSSQPIKHLEYIFSDLDREIQKNEVKVQKLLRNVYGRHGEHMSSILRYKLSWLTTDEKEIINTYLKRFKKEDVDLNFFREVESFHSKLRSSYIDKFDEDYRYNQKIKLLNTGTGAEFIALRCFNIETILGYDYPIKNYSYLKRALAKSTRNTDTLIL